MKKLLFVFNPFSGKAKIKNCLCDIIDIFNKADYEVTAYATQYKGQAGEIIASEGEKYDLIVCSGGDGTLNEAASGMVQLKNPPCLGYIPSGSTNDFGNSIGLPKNMKLCAKLLVKGKPFLCDIGQFNEKYFVYVAAFGAFTKVSYTTPQQTKNVLGHQAYLLEGMKQIGTIKPVHMKIKTDLHEEEGDYLFGMITNTLSVGGFKGLTGEDVKLNDGLFETIFVKNIENPLEIPRVVTNLLSKEKEDPFISHFKCSELCITSEENINWTLDGEFGGNIKEVKILVHEQAVKIMKVENPEENTQNTL